MNTNSSIITIEQLEQIKSSSFLIEKYIDDDSIKLAFKGVSPIVCNQIKLLQKSRSKLPSYYNSRCIIPSLSYEQSSSEAVASAKKFGHGYLAIDLTCGLGVDSLYISNHFQKVISVERDETLSLVARHNFSLLSAHNIEVVNQDACQFLRDYRCDNHSIDLIYIDPARRSDDKRVFLLEDCSPDMNYIMPLAIKLSKIVVVKLSPMFDVDAAYTFFSKYGSTSIETISLRNECKEVLVEIRQSSDEEHSHPTRGVRVVSDIATFREYSFTPILESTTIVPSDKNLSNYTYIYIADISFYQSRTLTNLMSQHYGFADYYQPSPNSPIFTKEPIEDFEGASYKILSLHPYKPKQLRKEFKIYGGKAKILVKDSNYSSEQIRRDLQLRDSSSPIVLFTMSDVIFLEQI